MPISPLGLAIAISKVGFGGGAVLHRKLRGEHDARRRCGWTARGSSGADECARRQQPSTRSPVSSSSRSTVHIQSTCEHTQ
uniref:Uncharacterized protein n=1 Tax=Leersia perrieri TaxID=77586 RepID=A0A0D9XKT0_9ORYZ